MKANSLVMVLLLLVPVAFKLLAQQGVSSNGTNTPKIDFTPDSPHTGRQGTNTTRPAETNVFTEMDIKAAEKGDGDAQFRVGWAYEYAQGAETNLAEAVKWFRKAAEQGVPEAQNSLGWIYLNGYGVTKNQPEAIKWLTKAAENGILQAAGRLGVNYLAGISLDKNPQEGIRWLRFAASRGEISDQRTLALIFEQGGMMPFQNDVEKSPSEAAKWYLRAARQGDGDSQFKIGEIYAKGEGVVQDFVAAYEWFNIAATSADAPNTNGIVFTHELTPDQKKDLAFLFETTAHKAQKARTELAQQMTTEQIAEAQQLSRKFTPHREGDSTSTDSPIASGTGFFITADGYLVSNYHVVKDAVSIRLLTGAGTISAKVVSVDAANDLALIKAEGTFSPLPITTSRTVVLGDTVATVGFPDVGLQGFSPKLAKGEIASLSGIQDDPRYFQISLPVQPGNSGGALVDERGNVVGIVSAKLSARAALAATGALPENVNYAVKSSFLLGFLEAVPDLSSKLKEPNIKGEAFDKVVQSAQQAAVLVVVY